MPGNEELTPRAISNSLIAALLITITDFCWISIPRRAARWSRSAGALMSNGVWLCAWASAGALAAPAALLMGLLLTWTMLKSGQTFTSSMTVMALMLGVACLGMALGVWVWLGYVLTDTFLIAHPLPHYGLFERLVRVRGSLLVSYLLLAALLIGIPLAAQAFSVLIVSGFRRGGRPRKIIVTILQPLLLGAMVYSWAQAAPILIAPVFIWKNVTLPATAPLHDRGWILALLAVLICAARSFAVSWAVAQPEVKTRIVRLKRALDALPRPTQWPAWAAAIARASLMTLMLAALFDGWLVAFACWMFLVLLGIAQADWIGQLQRWTRLVSYLPVIVRLLFGLALGVEVGRVILKYSHPNPSSGPLLLCLAVTMTAVALLLPKPAEASQTQGAALPLGGGAKLNVAGVAAAND